MSAPIQISGPHRRRVPVSAIALALVYVIAAVVIAVRLYQGGI